VTAPSAPPGYNPHRLSMNPSWPILARRRIVSAHFSKHYSVQTPNCAFGSQNSLPFGTSQSVGANLSLGGLHCCNISVKNFIREISEAPLKVVRPENDHPKPDLSFGELARHALGMFLARFLLKTRLPLRWFFRQCPRTFTEGQKLKFSVTKDPNDLIHSVRLAREMAERAEARGYFEESGALYVTSARLLHQAQSFLLILNNKTFSPPDMNRIFLEMYHGLGAIRALPSDDADYWQDRLTEALAALLPFVAAYPHEGMERLSAILAIAKAARVAELVPYRADSSVTPMKLSYAYMGGPARVHAAVAHLEVLGQANNQAIRRLEGLLQNEIEERDDLFYALMIGLAASRGADRMDLHSQWLDRIYSTIDTVREKYQP
jgi:hypothetical protein